MQLIKRYCVALRKLTAPIGFSLPLLHCCSMDCLKVREGSSADIRGFLCLYPRRRTNRGQRITVQIVRKWRKRLLPLPLAFRGFFARFLGFSIFLRLTADSDTINPDKTANNDSLWMKLLRNYAYPVAIKTFTEHVRFVFWGNLIGRRYWLLCFKHGFDMVPSS